MVNQQNLTNSDLKHYSFLECMYLSDYFPDFLVDKCKDVLINLCYEIEKNKPKNVNELYELTHKATENINDLEDEFFENDSEIETEAAECLALDFEYIVSAYGFEADLEELIAAREW